MTCPQPNHSHGSIAGRMLKYGLPIILYTGRGGDYAVDPEAARAYGITEVVVKPLEYDELNAVVDRLLGGLARWAQ